MYQKIRPAAADVKPRAISDVSGEVMPLEDLVLKYVDRPGQRIEIVGYSGGGKSTALAHLAALPQADRFVLLDDVSQGQIPNVSSDRVLIYTTTYELDRSSHRFVLAQWGEDELIELLLHRYPEHCASVMSRYRQDPDRLLLDGNPQLICLVAEQMVQHPNLSIKAAFRQVVESMLHGDQIRHKAQLFSFAVLLEKHQQAATQAAFLRSYPTLCRLLSMHSVRVWLAADHIAATLKNKPQTLEHRLPRDVIAAVAQRVQGDDAALQVLEQRQRTRGRDSKTPGMAASILHLADMQWRPSRKSVTSLAYGYFDQADWQEIDLRGMDLRGASLRGANLEMVNLERARLVHAQLADSDLRSAFLPHAEARMANFDGAVLHHAHLENGHFFNCGFQGARLRRAWASEASFRAANFRRADLSQGVFADCNFRRACFDNANLSGADLRGAQLHQADLRTATLDDVDFNRAQLPASNLEDVRITAGDFSHSNLTEALLSGSNMPGVNMFAAKLTRAGLADVDWEGADLREADMSNCSFHLGSTRCGLVGSPYPSHGTRTGFYTDDFDAHTFRAPEEIRKANLSKADLRGARVFQANFYLVDLRGARFDPDQERHFRRCDAILE